MKSLAKILAASIIMVICAYFIRQISPEFVDMGTFGGVFVQTALSGVIGVFVYFLTALILKSSEIKTIKFSFLEQFSPKPE